MLSQLQDLDISNNQLTSIPSEIGNLSQLNKLHLEYNLLTEIPEFLFRLTPRCQVVLWDNPLPPEELRRLEERRKAPDYKGPQFLTNFRKTEKLS